MTFDHLLFPTTTFPEEPGVQKLLGLCSQRQEGLWMQRIKVPGGRLTAEQWRTLADLAECFSHGTPLHLTTRQNVELHNLSAEAIPRVQAAMHEAGLTSFQAGGDTLRNTTVCSCCETVDLFPFSRQIEHVLSEIDGIFQMPRKFKIGLSCTGHCGQSWIHDLGLTALQKQGQWGFEVIVAGSLGAAPKTGMRLFEWLPADDVFPLAVAAVELFIEEADRENRRKARLRHVRQRWGDDEFKTRLLAKFEEQKAKHTWPSADLNLPEYSSKAQAVLAVPEGNISPATARALADWIDADLRVRQDVLHRIWVFAESQEMLDAALDQSSELAEMARPQPVIAACPGATWCKQALSETRHIAKRIREELGSLLGPGKTICISGCPNGCSHPAIADIGLIGGRENDKDVFTPLLDGGNGRTETLGRNIGTRLSIEEAIRLIRDHLKRPDNQ